MAAQSLHLDNLYIGANAPRAPYRRRSEIQKSAIHWGQRKLHLSEVEFFTLYWNPQQIPAPICVYAGAAHGTHLTLLSQLFPAFTFHLYDPGTFRIKADNVKIFIYNEYFTDETARQWAGRDDVFFISDIRTTDHEKELQDELKRRGLTSKSKPELIKAAEKASQINNETQIWEQDMAWQQTWVELMNPEHALLKFRLPYPYEGDQIVSYLQGVVYWQIWPGPTSTEGRLKPVRNAEGVYQRGTWSTLAYEEWMFYHNSVTREQTKFLDPLTGLARPVDPPELLDDFDSMAEAFIYELYCEKIGLTDRATIAATVKHLSHQTTVVITHNRPEHGLDHRRSEHAAKYRAVGIQTPASSSSH